MPYYTNIQRVSETLILNLEKSQKDSKTFEVMFLLRDGSRTETDFIEIYKPNTDQRTKKFFEAMKELNEKQNFFGFVDV